jgi:hypothetical protein
MVEKTHTSGIMAIRYLSQVGSFFGDSFNAVFHLIKRYAIMICNGKIHNY